MTVATLQLDKFIVHLLDRKKIKRILWLGIPVILSKFETNKIDQIYLYDPICQKSQFLGKFSSPNVKAKTFINRVIEVDFYGNFFIPKNLLKDSLIVCNELLEQLVDPSNLIKALSQIRLYCPYMIIATTDKLFLGAYMSQLNESEENTPLKYSAQSFLGLLIKNGFSPHMLYGHMTNSSRIAFKDKIMAVVGYEAELKIYSKPFTVAAIINIFNEADIIEFVVRYLVNQGVEVHIFDNWSDDGSYEICQKLLDKKLIKFLKRFPIKKKKEYLWKDQLDNTASYAITLDVDWVMHYDADEIRCSPWMEFTLNQSINFVDSLGYNAIDFTVINFRFTDENIDQALFIPENLSYFEFGKHEANFLQVKAWKNIKNIVNLSESGGHNVLFENRKVYPLNFLTKHYSYRNKIQATLKIFHNRIPRIRSEKKERGWHVHFDEYNFLDSILPWNKDELIYFNQLQFNDFYILERLARSGLAKHHFEKLNSNTAHMKIFNMKQELIKSRQILKTMEQDFNQLQKWLRISRLELDAILNSNSWKATQPLRILGNWLKNFKKKKI